MKKIIGISGSLREKSWNTMLLRAIKDVAKEKDMDVEIVEIGNLPLYNQDLEATFPEEAQILKDKIRASVGVIFATPEYNRSIPGVLKNAIDWASRPYGDSAFAGKAALVTGASIGSIGTAIGQSDLKEILLYLDMRVVGQPEFYLGPAQDKFDEGGNLDKGTIAHIEKSLDKFASFI
jgi:chromate reductase